MTEYEDEFVQQITQDSLAAQTKMLSNHKRKFEHQTHRIQEIDVIIKRLYEDNISGKLSDDRFVKMSRDYEEEQNALEASLAKLKNILEEQYQHSINIKSFLDIVRKYTNPKSLSPAMIHELIEKIVVYAPDKSSGHRTQQVDIYYNFVGEIDLPEHALSAKETA